MRSWLKLAAAAATLILPLHAAAQENLIHEIRGGILVHDVDFWGAGGEEDGISVNGELALGSNWEAFGGRLRPVVGASISGGDRISLGYADLRWEYTRSRVFFGVGVGAAIHDGDLDGDPGETDLGSRVLFHIPVELGYQFTPRNRVSLYYEHVSNAWLADPNPGMDNIGIRLAHRF